MNGILARLQTVGHYLDVVGRFSQIPGFLYDGEGFALTLLAAHGPGTGVVVEIGSFKGKSTCFLAHGCRQPDRGGVYAIDHFEGSPEHNKGGVNEDVDIMASGSTFDAFLKNIEAAALSDVITPFHASTEDAARFWNIPIRLLFIDGDHAYEAVRRDFELFVRHVVHGGVVCFHDFGHYEGVTRFVGELDAAEWEPAFTVQTMAVVTKR